MMSNILVVAAHPDDELLESEVQYEGMRTIEMWWIVSF